MLVAAGAIVSLMAPRPASAADAPTAPPQVSAPMVVNVNPATGGGTGLLVLANPKDEPWPLKLTSIVTVGNSPAPTVGFRSEETPGDGTARFEISVPPHSAARILVMIKDVFENGEYNADVLNGAEKVRSIRIVRKAPALSIELVPSGQSTLGVVRDQRFDFKIKNPDSVDYTVRWVLRLGAAELCGFGETLFLPRQSDVRVQCRPRIDWSASRFSDLFRAAPGTATIDVYPITETPANGAVEKNRVAAVARASNSNTPTGTADVDPAAAAEPGVAPPGSSTLLASVMMPATLTYFDPFLSQMFGYLVIVLVLVVGGVTSLVLSQALPNRLQRLNVKEQLGALAIMIGNLSTHIDSKVLVLVRLERNRLWQLLKSRTMISPDFPNVFNQCVAGAAQLKSRVELLQRVDVVAARLAAVVAVGAPPSKVDDVVKLVEKATVLLTKTQPSAAELHDAEVAIGDASTGVDALNQPDADFGQKLAGAVGEVRQCVGALSQRPTWTRLSAAVPGPGIILDGLPPAIQSISANSFIPVDMALTKLRLLRDYVLLKDGTSEPGMAGRLQQSESRLLDLLNLSSYAALRCARLVLCEMGEDIYPARLQDALLSNPPEAAIVIDPAIAYDRAPLDFSVTFFRGTIDDAAAKREWSCEWDFGDGLTGSGWKAAHYFELPKAHRLATLIKRLKKANPKTAVAAMPKPGEFRVKVRFRDHHGKLVADASQNVIEVTKIVAVRRSTDGVYFDDRAWTEGLKLASALLIAVFGLVAGARDQLLKLDVLPGLVAVFLVGFGADTIKSLLTSKS